MIESERWLETGSHRLSGTLCLPTGAGPFPLVLMIHGTGPLDRDENMRGQRLDVFNAIAHHLAAHGVGSLRYDKRGCGKSTGEYLTAGQADLVADAVAWVDQLRAESARVYLLGHSEGCIIAPRVSLERPEVAGLILLCPTVTPFRTVLMRQAEHIQAELERMPGLRGWLWSIALKFLGKPIDRQRELIERLASTTEPTLRAGVQTLPAKSFRELIALDLPAVFERVTCPALLIGGGKDVQCDPADVATIAALSPRFEGTVIPDLTHVLRRDDGAPSIFRYQEVLRQPLDPAVLERIAAWLSVTRAADTAVAAVDRSG